ncbi:MAG: pyruvate formate-lyase [Firmicutes bacterium]|nr:pyruvate formate-lyase [Bacillota bacterium]
MTERIQKQLTYFVKEKGHHALRRPADDPYRFAVKYSAEGLSDLDRSAARLRDFLAEETPVVFPDEKIAGLRTVPTVPEIFTEEEQEAIRAAHYIHEQGKVCNITPEYSLLLKGGFTPVRAEIRAARQRFADAGEADKVHYEDVLLQMLDTVSAFCERYRKAAIEAGNTVVAESFAQIPEHAPQTFLQALQFLRIIHYCLWCCFHYHNTLGRFDQYMLPWYQVDIAEGQIDNDTALELVEEFFLSLNRDSDLYPGMQQGDNGQSMALGGFDAEGNEMFNDLSALCLQASLELRLIDPKINLRVGRMTPLERYISGTRLTRQGLGFPQYSNDDIVCEALRKWGYREEDLTGYTVAACWEFIIPGYGMDIPNIASLSFPACVRRALERPEAWDSFDTLLSTVREEIFLESAALRDSVHNLYMEPAPFLSLMMYDTIGQAKDVSLGNRYNNFGFHGSGLSTAVDSLAAVRKYVFETGEISPEELLAALDDNFASEPLLQNRLRYEAPKMGNDDDEVDAIATWLLNDFADSLEGYRNERGGIYRAGTGSAMYYIWQAAQEKASPDGRAMGEAFAANYSPSLFTRLNGPLSIIKSFTKPDLTRVCNGGPLTIELSDSMFRNEESTVKTAQFVQAFILLGGHQLQINAVNRDELLDAKKHPENHRNLIVRVWGWSGYFTELDECYQDHIIKRMELTV